MSAKQGHYERISSSSIDLDQRIARDQQNAEASARLALQELHEFRAPARSGNSLHGTSEQEKSRFNYAKKRLAALEAIAADPFQVMVEVYTELAGENGKLQEKKQLWYANASSSANEVFKGDRGNIAVLA